MVPNKSLRPRSWRGWVVNLAKLRQLAAFADDPAFRSAFCQGKRAAKLRFADWLRRWSGQEVDPDSIFDCQTCPWQICRLTLVRKRRLESCIDNPRNGPGKPS
ncbi:MAG TPA: glycogen/starch/alpha-glucan phosphorylase [Candidatus Saccharimonadia bacterium]|nr:glycogen/starch/alpha-glucan phosphorylase [Candidatus Saccharimonadia bacterium]